MRRKFLMTIKGGREKFVNPVCEIFISATAAHEKIFGSAPAEERAARKQFQSLLFRVYLGASIICHNRIDNDVSSSEPIKI